MYTKHNNLIIDLNDPQNTNIKPILGHYPIPYLKKYASYAVFIVVLPLYPICCQTFSLKK